MEIFVDKFGSSDNFACALTEAVKNMQNGDTLVFSNKTYHIYKDFCRSRFVHFSNTDSFKNPQKYFAMLFEGLENITLDGNGATFAVHGDICSLGVIKCKNVNMRNFTINYPAPSNVEMTVKSKRGRKIIFEIPKTTLWYVQGRDIVFFEQSPFTKKNYWQFKNDENSSVSVCHSADGNVYRVPKVKGVFASVRSVKRLSMTEVEIEYALPRRFTVGDTYAVSQNDNRNTCGVFVGESENVSADNITVNYMAGFGWLTQMCGNVSFNNVVFKPDSAHRVSSFADLIHICGCKGQVKISNCSFEHPHDDGINIHGAFLRFNKKLSDNKAVFEFVHRQQGGYRAFNAGDRVKLYYRTSLAELPGEYTVKSAVDDIENKQVTVEFYEKLPQEIEARAVNQSNIVAENITYCPNVEISDCKFNSIPTRGILCTASGKVLIHGNTFNKVKMAHIFVSNDAADWYESGPVRDMEIYDNTFNVNKKGRGNNAVLIEPITLGRKISTPVHKNIKIHNNIFNMGSGIPVSALGVENLQVHDNVFNGSSKIKTKACRGVRL